MKTEIIVYHRPGESGPARYLDIVDYEISDGELEFTYRRADKVLERITTSLPFKIISHP